MKLKLRAWLTILVGATFFLAALLTLPHYNIMWDARNHFFKGQAFANFFLFGRKNYNGLSVTKDYTRYYRDYISINYPNLEVASRVSPDPNYRRSIYQDDVHTFDWLMQQPTTEHPVLSDIGSAIFNIIFYEKLGWLRDDHAYNLFAVALASLLVTLVFHWVSGVYGFVPAAIATIALATTPLFWAESHNNIKDIPQMTFFALAVWAFWQAVVRTSAGWMILSALLAGASFASKFNAVFLPFILGPWFVYFLIQQRKTWREIVKKLWLPILFYPAVMLAVLWGSWPQLWRNPLQGFLNVVSYYRSVGVGIDYTPAFRTIFGISTYAGLWIAVTTYPLVLGMGLIGLISLIQDLRTHVSSRGLRRLAESRDPVRIMGIPGQSRYDKLNKDCQGLPLLLVLWLAVPLIRASLPSTSIFGGVRHIIEYVPALAMLAGYGTYQLLKWLPKRYTFWMAIGFLFAFVPHVITLIRLHPAENAYFNSLIGGLSGAKAANLTGWGNTDGGIYRKALVWLNEHAEKNAYLATSISELVDFYLPEFRQDLRADNRFSGFLMEGEYIIALTHNSGLGHTYRLQYPRRYLTPLYEYKIDGVPLIMIWKNDRQYLTDELKRKKRLGIEKTVEKKDGVLLWDLGEVAMVESIQWWFRQSSDCPDLILGGFEISVDGQYWQKLPETYPGGPIEALGSQPQDGVLIAPVTVVPARYIAFRAEPENACVLTPNKSVITVLKD